MKNLATALIIVILTVSAFAQETKKPAQIEMPQMGDSVVLPEKSPQTAEEYFDYADKLWRKDYKANEDRVLESLNKAIELKPDYTDAFAFRAFVNNRVGNYKESIEDSNRTLQLSPERIRQYELIASSKTKLNDLKGALTALDYFISQYAAQGYYTLGSLQESGKLKYALGDYDGAIQEFTKAISKNRTLDPYFYRGATYLKKGDKVSALRDFKILDGEYTKSFEQSIKEYPDLYKEETDYPYDENPLASLKKQSRKRVRMKVDAIIIGSSRAVLIDETTGKEIKSDFPTIDEELVLDNWFIPSKKDYLSFGLSDGQQVIFYHIGLLLEENGESEEAEEAYTKALVYGISGKLSYNINFRRGKIRLANKQYKAAVRDFSWAIHNNKEFADAYVERGIAIFSLGHDQLAKKDFDKFLQLNPKGQNILNERISTAKKLRTESTKQKLSKI